MPRVLATPSVIYHQEGPHMDVLRSAGLEVVYPPTAAAIRDPQVLKELLTDDIQAVMASVEPYTSEVIQGSNLRVIARLGVGFDAVDMPAASENKVVVTTTPGTNQHSVAETAIALLTGVFRGLPWRYKEVQDCKWGKRALPRLAGKTIGLLGLGRIGQAMVNRCQGLGLEVIAYDPFPNAEFAAANNVRMCELEEVLATADIISLHLPALPETEDIINAGTLAKMKPGSVLINTSRGALVDEDALYEALAGGHLMGAGLDVFKQEPLPLESPLLKLDNVLMLPHTGGLDEESQEAMATLAARCVADLYQGRWPEECVVNRELKDGWKW